MFAGKHSWGNTKPFSVEPFRRRPFSRAPVDAILHWDADIDAFSEQTGGPHTFNHAVLSPQYQRNADGSYANVGAKPAVDVFGGKKWLRSCGAVQNKAVSVWNLSPADGHTIASGNQYWQGEPGIGSVPAGVTHTVTVVVEPYGDTPAQNVRLTVNDSLSWSGAVSEKFIVNGRTTMSLTFTGYASGKIYYKIGHQDAAGVADSTCFGGITVLSWMITATSYPVPYVPPGVTQPASNATTTNGSWFALPDGSPLWQALTGQPLTLATRVRMGVGSGDLASGGAANTISCAANIVRYRDIVGTKYPAASFDGATPALCVAAAWQRGAIVQQYVQVNTAGTQFRAGCVVEGTHTTIQWGAWVTYDGSMNPTSILRLQLGLDNAYPMWFNKITAWKKQVTDAEILEAMA